MQSTAEIIWQGKEEPLVFLDSLKEAHLFFLEGMTNGMNRPSWFPYSTCWLSIECSWLYLLAWRQRMLGSNIQSCTPNGGRTLQIFTLMAYTQLELGSCGERQDKPGSTFWVDRVKKTCWWLRTNRFCAHSSARHWVSLRRGEKSDDLQT
jgi:hypothetical protein